MRSSLKPLVLGLLLCALLFPAKTGAKTLTLDTAIKKALSTHPELRSRQEEIKAASYARKATAANRWLRADLVAQAERHSDPVAVLPIKGWGQFPAFSRDIYFWEVELSLPLYEGGRVAREVKIKELETLVQKSLLHQSTEDLIANVKQVYYQILYLKTLAQAQEEQLSLLKRQHQEAAFKYRLGKIAKLDLLYFERALREEEAALLATKENLRLAKHLLALLMGEERPDFEVTGDLQAAPSDLPAEEEGETYLAARPDVKAAALRVKQAEASLERAKRAYWPTVALFSSYGRRAGAGLHHDEEVWTAGLRFELNLFDSGGKRNRLRENQAQVLAAEEHLKAVRLKAREEILTALTQIQTARAQLEKYQATEAYAREVFERERVRYQTGAGAVTDLLSAQEAWLRAKTALVKAYYNLKTARVAFELATGQMSKEYLP